MRLLRVGWARLTGSLTPARGDREIAEELQAHVRLHVEESLRAGIPEGEARRDALLRLGGIQSVTEQYRSGSRLSAIETWWIDIRYAARALKRSPGFTAVAVLSLAVGIGSTAAVYGTADWLLNRSPGGVRDPERLVALNTTDRNHPNMTGYNFSYQQFTDMEKIQDAFAGIATYAKFAGNISSDTSSDQVVMELVSGNYFSLLGVGPAVGRTIVPEDDSEAAPLVAVLSDGLWRSRFGADPKTVGSDVQLNGQLCRVVGILPSGFEGFNLDWNGPTNIWLAMHAINRLGGQLMSPSGIRTPFVPIIGRLPDGMSVQTAVQKAQAWWPQLRPASATRFFQPTGIVARPISEMRIARRERAQTFLRVLLIVCGLIFVAACVNVANFMVGRAVSRRRELALRAALGASRARLVRQLLTEAFLLGAGAAGLGAVVAVGAAHVLATLPRIYLDLPPASFEVTTSGSVDWRMAASAMALGGGSVFLFGLLPALLAAFRNPIEDLKQPKPHWTWCGVHVTSRQVVLALQVAVAVALSVTAGLYATSFARAARVETGYANATSVLLARTVVGGLSVPRQTAFFTALMTQLNEMPEVVSASVGWNPPYMIGRQLMRTPEDDEHPIDGAVSAASAKFFETQGIPVVAGREFSNAEDDAHGLVINQVLAQRFWPNQDPVGRTLLYGSDRQPHIVTGVVSDAHCADLLAEPQPCAWLPYPMSGSSAYLRIRTKGEPLELVPSLRRVVHELLPTAAVSEEATLDSFLKELTSKQELAADISGGLALLGVCLLAIGCVSLFLSMVKDSAQEIAIRMALGATRAALSRRILFQGMLLALIGSLMGSVGAWVISHRIADQLYQTAPTDPVAFVGAPALVIAMALLAVYYSASVAARTNPAQHLRGD